MAFWTLSYGGSTRGADEWGMNRVGRRRKSLATDTVRFMMEGANVDSTPIFPCLINTLPASTIPKVLISRNGVQWFYGWVTRIPGQANGQNESLGFEISNPWYWLEKTIFQQMWATLDSGGGGATTKTTARSNIILAQSLDGIKMNSQQVLLEVLYYCQYAFQGIDFPTTVTLDHLPPAPNQDNGPFRIGTLAPTITIPYSQLRDKSCADIVRLVMKYSPDCVAWFDYSTSPPTLNIDKRANLTKKTVTLFSPADGKNLQLLTAFNPTPRYDLQVPAVIAKFESHETADGTSYDKTVVDKYPADVKDNAPRAWVQTIDLIGSSSTTQSVDIKVIERPTSIASVSGPAWYIYKESWLKMKKTGTTDPAFDSNPDNFQLVYLNTVIDENDPLNTENPNGVTLPNCHQLVNELLTGTWEDWLQGAEQLDAAKVMIECWTKYNGTDANTAACFTFDPANPSKPTPPGAGYRVNYFSSKITNASTQTYSQLTSFSAAEPVPVGFAQYLYTALQKLHYDGTLTAVEEECSDPLPLGCTFNTTDGDNPNFKNMDALVLSVDEDVDNGTTSVQFGPPLMLGLRELEELFRSNLGRLPSYKLDQRQTGKIAGGAKVQSAKHAADTHTIAPPVPSSSTQEFPFQVLWRIKPGSLGPGFLFEFKIVLNSNLLLSQNLYDNTAITGLDTWTPLDANDTIWLLSEVSNNNVVPGTPTIHNYGNGNTDYNGMAAPWTPGGITEYDGDGNQTVFRKVIATSVPDGVGKPIVKQFVQTDLVAQLRQIDFSSGLYPLPL